MKTKHIAIAIVLVLALCATFALSACEPEATTQITVTYISDGKVFGAEKVDIGKTAVGLADKPEKNGYNFVDWFRDDGTFDEVFKLTDILTEDIRVYALFMTKVADPSKIIYSENGSSVVGYDGQPYNELTIPSQNNGVSVTGIADRAFYDKDFVTKVYIPSTITQIGNYSFYGCNKLESVSIGASVQSIGNYAFSGCEMLGSISVDQGNTTFRDEGDCVISIDDSELVIGSIYATIPNSVDTIGQGAFYGLKQLARIRIPSSVTVIKPYAFAYTSITNLDIPDSVTEILYNAFGNCGKLEKVSLGSGLTTIDLGTTGAFVGCYKLAQLTVSLNNNKYRAEGNCLIEKDTNNLVLGCAGSVIPEGIVGISSRAFYDCRELQTIVIPASIKHIDYPSFEYCSGLQNISVAAGNTVYRSEGNCLIKIDGNVLVLGCKTSVIPSDAKSIYAGAFKGAALTSIVIPDGVTEMGDSAFADCKSLTSVTIGAGIKIIDTETFKNCTSLSEINLHNEITKIGGSAFQNCTSLESIVLPDSVTEIKYGAFSGCSSLRDVALGKGVSIIENNAFADCVKLASVTAPTEGWKVAAYNGSEDVASIAIGDATTMAGLLKGQYKEMCWMRKPL